MPSALTYPGVYVEEIPSGVRTITGVSTSITAFIGRARRGAVNQATTINNFGDFEKIFGGLSLDSSLGYAVKDFFLNGGAQAVIVRLYHADPGNPAAMPPVPAPGAKAALTAGGIALTAANEGRWGVNLRATVDKNNPSADVAAALGVAMGDLFNLTVTDTGTGQTEKFVNVTVVDSARRLDKVLAAESRLVSYTLPNPLPNVSAGSDPLSQAEAALAAAKKALVDKQNSDPGNVAAETAAVPTAQAALDTALTNAKNAVSDGLGLSVLDFLPANG
ncbi:MAG: phage tail sheath family protein, partial [Bryobacteraceae bacterium]